MSLLGLDVEHLQEVVPPNRREADLRGRVRWGLDLRLHAGSLEPLRSPLLAFALLYPCFEDRQAKELWPVLLVGADELLSHVDVRPGDEPGAGHRVRGHPR